MQPADLTNLVEQIAGTDVLRPEYEQLELAKQSAEEKTSYVFSKKKSIAMEKRQKREQKEEAEKHLQLEKDLAALKTEFYLWKLYHIDHDTAAAATELEKLEDGLAVKGEVVAEVEGQVKEKRRAQAGLSKQRMLLEKKVQKMRLDIDDQSPELVTLQGELERIGRRIQKGKRDLEVSGTERDKVERTKGKIEADQAAVTSAMEAHAASKDSSGGIQLTAEQRAEFAALEAEAGAASFKLAQDRDELRSAQKADEGQLETLMKESEQLKKRVEAQDAEYTKTVEEKERLAELLEKDRESLAEKRQERRRLADAARSSGSKREQLDKQLQDVEGKLREARADRRESDRERKMKEAVAAMKQIFPGVYGRMTDLAEVTNRQYNLALSVLLGRHMDSVVVDSDKTARECVQYLKEHRLFSMTFIPLQNLKISPINERLRQLGGSVKLAIDVVQFEPHLERAFIHVMENSLVCDGVDEARRLGYHSGEKLKVCACDGTLISRNGNITGGGSSGMEDRARRWDQKAVDELKAQREELQLGMKELPDLREVRAQEVAVTADITGLEQRMKFKESEIQRLSAKESKLQDDLQRVRNALAAQEPRERALAKEVKRRAGALSAAEAAVTEVHSKYFRSFSERLGVENVHQLMEMHDKAMAEFNAAEARFKSQLAQLKNHLSLLKKQLKDVCAKEASIQATMAKDEQAVVDLKAKEAEFCARKADLEAEIATEQEAIQQLQVQIDANEEEVNAIQKEAAQALGEVNKMRRGIASKKSQLEQLAVQLEDTLEAASIEGVALPHLHRQADATPSAMQVDGGDGDTEMADAEMASAEGRDLDFSQLKRTHTATLAPADRDALNEEFKSSIDELVTTMERHAPNMKAMEQYEQIKEKERHHAEELEATKAEAKRATEAFNQLRARRYQLFTTAFDHISLSIDPIYKELTKSKSHQLGGTAYLSLENPDEPFLHGIKYTAMPPSKRFRDMEQLSGGEKTIAALSLLFAIHSYKPSPFFVLDECDAALDSTNVARIAAFVRARSRHEAKNSCQSIVISLKDIFYNQADSLVGVSKDLKQGSSTTYTLDLNRFK
mmetsp:Transcript_2185/g.5451  ORF Transcript_2185/g.5451 Transcript_2185/m.5451 type:complete len:1077 (-) Transcript_2185:247-3477(-)